MIEQVQKIQKQEELDDNPIWSRVETKILDAQALDGIEDMSISHITGTMVYNLVANGRKALEAAHRVLEPAGLIGMTLGAGAEWMDMVRIPLLLFPMPPSQHIHILVMFGPCSVHHGPFLIA
jgi:ubiquinone/menaquinone biosynthesis C-methylase UbiE